MKSHQEYSCKKLQYFDPEENENYVPYVVETSIGCDRMFLAILSQAYQEETVPDAEGQHATRIVLKLHPALAPVKCAVLPLVKNKPELVDLSKQVLGKLKSSFQCQYDDKDAIGRRYRRQDAIGTPCCVTVDFDSLSDGTVTLRDRDSLQQERISIDDLVKTIEARISWTNLF